ncbi:MAG TPA: hypothetical protein VNM90_03365, partial [Haliangium sp.]|nr:hypothetical protein [Haliangium sp.]
MAPTLSIGAPAHNASPESASGIQTVTGTVIHTESGWDDPADSSDPSAPRGGRIFTHVDIALADGSTMTVRQSGGTVGDIGMVQIPSPPLLRPGDRVEARVAPFAVGRSSGHSSGTGTGWFVVDVSSLVRSGDAGAPEPVTLPGSDLEKQAGSPLPVSEPVREIDDGSRPHAEFVRTMTDGGAPLHWGSGCTYIVFDSAGTTHLAGDQEFEIMEQALAQWRDKTASCSYMDFVVEEPRSMEVGYDGFNVVKFREARWCRPAPDGGDEECYAFNAAGLTTLTFIDNPDSKRYGEILDADIEINGTERFAISAGGETLAPAGRDLADLANTFTHEAGHFLGLDHACRTAGEPSRLDHEGKEVPLCAGALLEATMHPTQDNGETKKASLEQDDIDGACAIHPLAEDPRRCAPVDLTPERRYCTIAPDAAGGSAGDTGSSPLAFAGLLLGAVLLLRR